MELDTGSAVSIILFDLYQQRFNRLSLHKTGLSLNTYTGENIVPVGILKVLVDYQTQIKLLDLEWSEWAPTIVPVPKKDGSVRLFGDYKVTVNLELQVEQCPLPRIKDIFPNLVGGLKFSKIDLP